MGTQASTHGPSLSSQALASEGDRASEAPTPPSKPFLCRRPVRLTIYAFFALLLIAMVSWRYVPILLDPTFEKHIAEKRVVVGMTRQQVLQAWGSPYSMNVSYTKDGLRREEWIYEDWESASDVRHRYLYFEENILVGGWYYSNDPSPKAVAPPKFHQTDPLKDLGGS
ncbi:hypothetical protein [Candidatus Nitrospira bockiana]